MTNDDIVRMAQEAGMVVVNDQFSLFRVLVRFAALVAAHEREQCAVDIESTSKAYWAYRAGEIVRARKSNDQSN